MSTTDQTGSLRDECFRQEENCAYTSLTFIIWLRVLRAIRTTMTVLPIVCGAIATYKVVAQESPAVGAVCALLATIIPPALRASKIDKSIEEYASLAGEYTNLRDRFRQMARIASQQSFGQFELQAKPYFDRLEKARKLAYTPPEWCFKLAQKKMKSGDYKHDYDLDQGKQ